MRMLQRAHSATRSFLFRAPCRIRRAWLATTTQAGGYQSIGSFHSDNLADLLALPDSDYVPPTLPFDANDGRPPLGSNDIRDDFLIDFDNWTFLNHGAFGGGLRVAVTRAEQWRMYLERQPLRFFDRDLLPHLVYSTRELARFIGASPQTVVLLPNVTSGLNSVIGGYKRVFGDAAHVFVWDTSYGSVKKMAKHYCGSKSVTEIPLQARYLNQLAVDPHRAMHEALETTLDSIHLKNKVPLLILDHTSSNTALTFPVQTLTRSFKRRFPESPVLVDGAHGLLAQPLCLSDLPNVDFYVSNCHKWFGAPRGVGLCYAKPEWHDTILCRPAIVSHGVDEPDFFSRFVWDGCRDYAAALSVPVVLDYWGERRPEIVRRTMKDTLCRGIQILADAWHAESANVRDWAGCVTLVDFEQHNVLSPMALIRLPRDRFNGGLTSVDAKAVQDVLFHAGIEVPIKCIDGELFVRTSCHLYNDEKDFAALARALLKYDK